MKEGIFVIGVEIICRGVGYCILTLLKVSIICWFTALLLCQFKKENCIDPHQSVKEVTGELAKAYITGRECKVSEHQEANTKKFTLTSREVRSSKALCPRSQSILLPASIFVVVV